LFKDPPVLLAFILEEEEFEPAPEELLETGAMEDEDDPPLAA
jgi:hypothetical protein